MTICLSQAQLGSPALAFVRLLCHLLAQDSALRDEVALLRRRLLRLVGTDEFSPAAAFVDPCLSFRLRDVICPTCSDARELDVCRDASGGSAAAWACPVCGGAYDAARIEARLVSALQARLRSYVLQDLTCTKCSTVTGWRMCPHCPSCGGGLAPTLTPADARKQLAVFSSLAAFHGFALLQQLASSALGDGGAAAH
jgi:DNA polymerase epsilon subunit 1